MSESADQTPPRGDFQKAEKYINQLVNLINQKKIEVFHTDLKKFDPTTLHDHYSIALQDYQIEISHSKPDSDKSSYVMIFNNLRQLSSGTGQKVILAYIYLADSQFSKFKVVADRRLEERRKVEEEKKFNDAVAPIDQLLENVAGDEPVAEAPVYQSNITSNPLMQSFEQDFQNQLNSSLEKSEDERDFSNLPRIHQV